MYGSGSGTLVGIMEKIDQGSVHPSKKHYETDISRPVYEPWPPASQAGTLPKSYLYSLLICLSGPATVFYIEYVDLIY
jgi:hypothetical protein